MILDGRPVQFVTVYTNKDKAPVATVYSPCTQTTLLVIGETEYMEYHGHARGPMRQARLAAVGAKRFTTYRVAPDWQPGDPLARVHLKG